ncbi:alpha/beta fold hydrolase [Actinophytocola xanthii]|uniref:Alpha/beta hydrolase n=1 Tax=Actinophytocola xanthii TaxID=1912961 RepID=A0A1Q8CMC1_9PSEU|nr:alpha/beta hydrolase [Actinophytocola xanthii]OLF15491.1 alpha/beta hydrolase [Actinophytocola xanthii]
MTTYVLIPGYWLGAWAWRPVTEALRARGHEVHALSLTGMAERVHLATPQTDLAVHVTDVLNLLHYEDLTDVVLVGHSYGGAAVIAGVADRAPKRIAQLVFVDTGPLPDGMAMADFGAEEHEANAARVAAEGDGWRLPPPPWEQLASAVPDLDQAVLTALRERAVPQPWATATTPVSLTGQWETLPRLCVACEFTEEQARGWAAEVPLFAHMGGDRWTYAELPTWHWPMFTEPAALAEILLGVS